MSVSACLVVGVNRRSSIGRKRWNKGSKRLNIGRKRWNKGKKKSSAGRRSQMRQFSSDIIIL